MSDVQQESQFAEGVRELNALKHDDAGLADSELKSMLEQMQQSISDADKAPFASLRQLPTRQRRLIALGVCGLIFAALFFFMRVDVVETLPAWYTASTIGAAFVLSIGLILVGLRPEHASPMHPSIVVVLCGAAFASSVSSVVFGMATNAPVTSPGLRAHLMCAGIGGVVAVVVTLLIHALDRHSRSGRLLAPLGGALLGHAVSLSHCPIHSVTHGLFGHGALIWFAALIGGVWMWRRSLRDAA